MKNKVGFVWLFPVPKVQYPSSFRLSYQPVDVTDPPAQALWVLKAFLGFLRRHAMLGQVFMIRNSIIALYSRI